MTLFTYRIEIRIWDQVAPFMFDRTLTTLLASGSGDLPEERGPGLKL